MSFAKYPLMALIGGACASAAVASPTVSTFDLYCLPVGLGMQVDGKYEDAPTQKMEPFRLSVDLRRATWCYRPCRVRGVVETSDNELRLHGGPSVTGEDRGILIDRDTGSLVKGWQLNQTIFMVSTYKCYNKEFTPIPNRKF